MKMFCFKFNQNRQINEEFYVFKGRGGEGVSIIIGEHMKTLCFKFHQNHQINEEFDCWGFKGTRGFQGTPISKIQKTPHTERWS